VYPTWLREIARQAAQSGRCMEITGHTSASGSETLNERLSQQRAESIKKALEADGSELIGRLVARGAGSRDNLAGTGSDDHSDFLDRRIVFSPIPCPRLETQTAHR
jgi:outer membrane protein OmpA-like peptidoglycan-associated protein